MNRMEATEQEDDQPDELELVYEELDKAQRELSETRENAALVVNALSAALQWGEALFAWVPEGTTLPEGVKTAKGALDQAMNAIRSKQS